MIDGKSRCVGMVSQADLARSEQPDKVHRTVAEISKLARHHSRHHDRPKSKLTEWETPRRNYTPIGVQANVWEVHSASRSRVCLRMPITSSKKASWLPTKVDEWKRFLATTGALALRSRGRAL